MLNLLTFRHWFEQSWMLAPALPAPPLAVAPRVAGSWWDEDLERVGHYAGLPGVAVDLALGGGRACVLCKRGPGASRSPHQAMPGAVAILDVRNPARPRLLGAWTPEEHLNAMTLVGTTLYAVTRSPNNRQSQLRIIDLADPAAPVVLGTYRCAHMIFAVRVCASRIFMAQCEPRAAGVTGCQVVILDGADPQALRPIGSWKVSAALRDVQVEGERMAIFSNGYPGWNRVEILDLANPAAPVLLNSFTPESNASHAENAVLRLAGGRCFVSCWGRVYAAELGRPGPQAVGAAYATPARPGRGDDVVDMALESSRLYLALGRLGVQVINVARPAAAGGRKNKCHTIPGEANAIRAMGNLVFVAAGEAGLTVLRYEGE